MAAESRRLFALDQNFPLPIVEVLSDFMAEAQLVPIAEIDTRLADLDDWEVLWPSIITTAAGTV